MPDSHVKFHSSNGKRRVLVVDDEQINREILKNILQEDYEVIEAASGAETLEIMRAQSSTLSLVLLDLLMPDSHGLDILRKIKDEPQLARVPVIVVTSDRAAEVESLTIGAIDFIPKPYPEPRVILARVLRTIELSEDRDIIRWTERDQLTGLYNREYFYRYAEQFDLHHRDMPMDAIVVDVNHFRMINERYGKAYGDEVLKRIGEKVREMVRDSGGIVCRREGDTFLVYCPHRSDYTDILENASVGLAGSGLADGRVRLRMGIYSDVDKTIDIERRFDRAKMASDTVRSNFTKAIAIYDNALHETEIFAEQLLEDFPKAVRERQFEVFYQPKYDIRPVMPVLQSAEALVRWRHPELGMISPAVFIPLFESNGLIHELDSYVWREAASQIHDWKTRLGISVPVSVNVSRIDMYDSGIVAELTDLVAEFGMRTEELLLEITESACTQDSEQIIEAVNHLRQVGFRIEMDDFGTGYSSLNMISTLPIDALKLDMQFIRNAFSERKDTRMLEIIIEIAESLGVPTIAEGVETAEQMFTLKAMGCDVVQGYYFSRPLPSAEFEEFLLEKKRIDGSSEKELHEKTEIPGDSRRRSLSDRSAIHRRAQEKFTYDALHDPLTGLYNHSAFELLFHDMDQDHIALLIMSINGYRLIAETQGREAGDRVVRHVADILRQTFRSVDLLCRIGSSEFVVIMTRVNSAMRGLVLNKVNQANRLLGEASEDVPAVTLSVGAAFSDREDPQGDVFEDADRMLSGIRDEGKAACAVY